MRFYRKRISPHQPHLSRRNEKSIYGEEQRTIGKNLAKAEAIRRAQDREAEADVFGVTQEQFDRIVEDIKKEMDDEAIVRDVDWGDNSFKKVVDIDPRG